MNGCTVDDGPPGSPHPRSIGHASGRDRAASGHAVRDQRSELAVERKIAHRSRRTAGPRSRRSRRSTGWTSVGELEITRRISPVAVCCSRASVRSAFLVCSSVSSRAFSMAMAAWSAKVSIRAIWLSVNGRTSCAVDDDHAEQLVRPEHGDREHGPDAARPARDAVGVLGVGLDVGDVDGPPLERGAAGGARRARARWDSSLEEGPELGARRCGRRRAAGTCPSNRQIKRALGLAQPDRVLGQRLEAPAGDRRWSARSP